MRRTHSLCVSVAAGAALGEKDKGDRLECHVAKS